VSEGLALSISSLALFLNALATLVTRWFKTRENFRLIFKLRDKLEKFRGKA
jgi:hypothetical protein